MVSFGDFNQGDYDYLENFQSQNSANLLPKMVKEIRLRFS